MTKLKTFYENLISADFRLSKKPDFIPEDLSLKIVISVCSGLLVFFFLISAFYYGINRNFHHVIPEAVEYQNVNLAIALTERVYGLNEGHVAHTKVYDTIRENGIAYYKHFLDPLGVTFPDNLSNPVLINKALTEASTLPPLQHPTKIMSEIKPIEPNDVGMSEYYKASFAIFGVRVQAFYLFYFFIFIASIVFYYIRFFNSPVLCSILPAIVGVHFTMFIYIWEILPPEQQFGIGTPYAPRFISILGVLPALHIALEILKNQRFNLVYTALLIPQIALLAWLLTMRGTVMWEVLWVVSIIILLTLVLIAKRLIMYRSDPIHVTRALAHLFSVPIALFAVIMVGYSSYYTSSLNPLYRFSDEFIPTHMVWHSVYAGLEQHPEWVEQFGEAHSKNGKRMSGDGVPIIAAENYLKEKYNIDEQYYISPIFGLKYRTTERIIKEVYWNFVKENPRYVLELQFIYKPLGFYRAVKSNFLKTYAKVPVSAYLGLFLSALIILLSSLYYRKESGRDIYALSFLIPLGMAISFAPIFVTFAAHGIIGDQFYMIILAVPCLLMLAPSLLYSAYRHWKENR